MWKDYSSGYIKNNRSSGLSIRLSAFISALLLSLLCGLFYNAWKYEIERIEQEAGGWQSRIVAKLDDKEIDVIRNFASVKDVVVNEKERKGAEITADIYFHDRRMAFSDTPRIAKLVGASQEKISYNYELLAMYLIRDSKDTAPRLVFPMFIVIMVLASLSLIVMIHNSFAVSMNARIYQFGILSSIGATPKQIRVCLMQEAAALCAVPIIAGNLLGIVSSMGFLHMINVLSEDVSGRHEAVFRYHPFVCAVTILITVITIWISAWIPARKLSRLTPLEAIKNAGELQLKRKKNAYFFTLLFGVEGALAGNAQKAQRKALRTSFLSFVFSFLAFTIMQCFFSLSGISTRETYFERYQDVWDIMVTVKNTEIDTFQETEAVVGIAGVESAIVYQKAMAKRMITEEEMSEEMKSFGGFSHAPVQYVTRADRGWLVNAPIVILDDDSFITYCKQIGITPKLNGAVVLNQIRDITNPDFRHPKFMPYIKENGDEGNTTSLFMQEGKEDEAAEIPVLSYTKEVPALREEYATQDYYELVHFIPVSLWRKIKGQVGEMEKDTYICVLGTEDAELEELNMLQDDMDQLVSKNYTVECENRIREYETNHTQIQGFMILSGSFCVLLAVIGIGSVFSNTLGFVRQRKREFARYLSIGMTPKEIRKMFCIEAFGIAGRPILIALPLAVMIVLYMLKMSYIEVGEFLAEAPLIPIVFFMLAIFGFVVLAYSFAWRSVKKISLADVLRDDTMM